MQTEKTVYCCICVSKFSGFDLSGFIQATVSQICELDLDAHVSKLLPIAASAEKEAGVEDQVNSIAASWQEVVACCCNSRKSYMKKQRGKTAPILFQSFPSRRLNIFYKESKIHFYTIVLNAVGGIESARNIRLRWNFDKPESCRYTFRWPIVLFGILHCRRIWKHWWRRSRPICRYWRRVATTAEQTGIQP